MKHAVIIKHPCRDLDWRIDIIDSDLPVDEIRDQIQNEMLGEVVAITHKINFDRKLRQFQSGRVGCVHNTLKYIGPWYSCETCGTHFYARAEAPSEGALDF